MGATSRGSNRPRRSARARPVVALATAVTLVGAMAACAPPPSGVKPLLNVDGWSRSAISRSVIEPVADIAGLAWLDVGVWAAFGDESEAPGALRAPAAWVSGDANRWDRATFPKLVEQVGRVAGMASNKTVAVAVGSIGMASRAEPVVWTSTDGRRWEGPVVLPQADGSRGVAVRGVTLGPSGFVAVGGPVASGSGGTATWRSPDGHAWELVAPDGANPSAGSTPGAGKPASTDPWAGVELPPDVGPPSAEGSRGAVRAHQGGRFVLIDPVTNVVWVRDGVQPWWRATASAIPPARRARAEAVRALAASEKLLVAVGASIPVRTAGDQGSAGVRPQGRIWYSLDAITWKESVISAAVETVDAVERTGTGFLALGTRRDVDGELAAISLSSPDGTGWSVVGTVAYGAQPGALTTFQALSIAAGSSFPAGEDGGAQPAIWTSVNGTDWQAVDLFGDVSVVGSVRALCRRGDELLAVGEAGLLGGGVHVRVWSTRDGRAWRDVTGVPLGAQRGPFSRYDACAQGSTPSDLLVVGSLDSDAVLWRYDGNDLSVPADPMPIDGGSGVAWASSAGWVGERWMLPGSRAGRPSSWSSRPGGGVEPVGAVAALADGTAGGALSSMVVFGDHLVLAGTLDDAPLVLLGPTNP